MHPRTFLYRLLPKCCQDLKRKLKNKIISELPTSVTSVLTDKWNQVREIGFRNPGKFCFFTVDSELSHNTFIFPMSTSTRSKFL